MKKFIKRVLSSMYDLTISITSQDGNGHRYATAEIGGRVRVRKTYVYNHLCEIGVLTSVKDAPQECLEQVRSDDNYNSGCPHHYELSNDSTEILYVRHGTNAFGETGHEFVEKRFNEVWVYESFKEEELDSLPKGKDTYHESVKNTIVLAANAVNALVY